MWKSRRFSSSIELLAILWGDAVFFVIILEVSFIEYGKHVVVSSLIAQVQWGLKRFLLWGHHFLLNA